MKSAMKNGVRKIVVVEHLPQRWLETLSFCEMYDCLIPACGIHPCYLPDDIDRWAEVLAGIAPRLAAIGEIGLDGYSGDTIRQFEAFTLQIGLAQKHGLPILIHCRNAFDKILEAHKAHRFRGKALLHCYSGSAEQAESFVARGFYFSFAGVVTFRNAKKVHKALRVIPTDKILIETDAPDLTPYPYRDRENEPALLPFVAYATAESLDIPILEFTETIFENSRRFFSF